MGDTLGRPWKLCSMAFGRWGCPWSLQLLTAGHGFTSLRDPTSLPPALSTSTSTMRKPRPREGKPFASGHTADKQQGWAQTHFLVVAAVCPSTKGSLRAARCLPIRGAWGRARANPWPQSGRLGHPLWPWPDPDPSKCTSQLQGSCNVVETENLMYL